jgi:hypothetical protein
MDGTQQIWRKYTCDLCQRTFNGSHEWNQHQTSRRHRSALSHASRQVQRTMATATAPTSATTDPKPTDPVATESLTSLV